MKGDAVVGRGAVGLCGPGIDQQQYDRTGSRLSAAQFEPAEPADETDRIDKIGRQHVRNRDCPGQAGPRRNRGEIVAGQSGVERIELIASDAVGIFAYRHIEVRLLGKPALELDVFVGRV